MSAFLQNIFVQMLAKVILILKDNSNAKERKVKVKY